MIKIFGIRQSLIGDTVMSLPMLEYLKKKFPDSYIYFHIARKCSQSSELFKHPLIDEIVISDCEEGMGEKDYEVAKKCDIVINTTPQHPEGGETWHSRYTCVEETVRMSYGDWVKKDLGLNSPDELLLDFKRVLREKEQKPMLLKPCEQEQEDFVALWPCAGYGKWNVRNPSQGFYQDLVKEIEKSICKVAVFGHPDDFNLESSLNYKKLSFVDQIKKTLQSKIMIGTDSGSSWIIGAYGHPQINLLTKWYPNHKEGFWPLAPENYLKKNIDICVNSWNNITVEMVINKILWKKKK